MDVNGTRFHLLQGAPDWSRCAPAGEADAIALGDSVSLAPRLFQFQASKAAVPADPAALRRGGARDRYGNWYWIDGDGARVLVRSAGDNALAVFWKPPVVPAAAVGPARGAFGPLVPPPDPPARRFAGLAVTEDHYLLVGTLDQPGLLVFDLHAGGLPRHVRWPASRPFAPFDMAPRAGGGVFILDRDNRAYWALDRQLGVLDPAAGAPAPPDTFTAFDAAEPAPLPAPAWPVGMAVAASSPLAAADPVAIEALPDGTVLVLDRQPVPTIHRYRLADHLGSVVLDLSPVLDPAAGAPALGADLAYVAGATDGDDRLFVPAADGAQCFAFTIAWRDQPLAVAAAADAPFLPMRLYGGKGIVASAGAAYYDFGASGSPTEAWLQLVAQRRPRYELTGAFVTPPFDGVEPGCVWHRLIFDGCVPAGARVTVESRTADELEDLDDALWAPEPAPRQRASGRELPFSAPIPAPQTPAPLDAGSFELLFQRASGRWLQLRITLAGDGRTSPRLRALRVWYPRFSYLAQYLPATYRDDAESASFLDRFLANLEGVFTNVEDRMAAAQALFDARTAPVEALDWLAGWFGVALDPAWDETKRRLFLRHAMDFFRIRGTVRGLQTALRLVIDDCVDDDLFLADTGDAPASIRIVEWFRLRALPPLALGDPAPAAGIRQISAPPAPNTVDPRWLPAQGRAALLSRWSAALDAACLPDGDLPLAVPADAATASAWQAFADAALGFTPGTGPAAQQAYRDFLARRYRRIAVYDTTYGDAATTFDEIPLPATLPADGAPLRDWYEFNAIALATRATGHRFTVLLPVPAREAFALEQHAQRRALAQRIIELEKPAHTVYDVKFYWAMFRVGEARLALDTLLDQSSRAPELMPPVVLGQSFLSEGRLAATPPEREQERPILGTFPLRSGQNPEETRS